MQIVRTILVTTLLATLPTLSLAQGQTQGGGLTPKLIGELEQSLPQTPAEKALRNAVVAQGMKALVLNTSRDLNIDDQFNVEVESKGITNQQSSGRCWLFTGLNVFRAKMIAKEGTNAFFFSHNYSFFWDQLEKANLFLQSVIDTRKSPIDDKTVSWLFRNPIGDGGQFTGISDNLIKYGVVPSEVMPETYASNNTSNLSSIVARTLRQTGIRIREAAEKGESLSKLESRKKEGLKQVYQILTLNLGIPPKTFTYSLKDSKGRVISTEVYTPQSFYKKFVGETFQDEYVMLMNDPSRPYNKVYEIDYDRHSYDGRNWKYVNLPIEEIKQMAIASLKDSTMMYYSCDVARELDRNRGVMALDNYDYASLLGFNFDMTKKERIQTFDSGSTHAMTLKAVNLDKDGKPTKWKVENSWGAQSGVNGHLIMTDEWFDAYTFRLVVRKKYATDKVLSLLKEQPTRLPAWDPMFRSDD